MQLSNKKMEKEINKYKENAIARIKNYRKLIQLEPEGEWKEELRWWINSEKKYLKDLEFWHDVETGKYNLCDRYIKRWNIKI